MNRCHALFILKTYAALVALAMAVLICVPATARAQGTPADQLTGKLVITGASTLAPVIAEIGKRFESLYPTGRIDVQSGGSSRGVADVRQGLSDIGMVSRTMKEDERDLSAFPVARDGVCPILHQDNPVQAIADEQVVAIYTEARSPIGRRSVGRARRSPS